MIAVVPVANNEVDTLISPRFGRSKYLILINTRKKKYEFIDNTFLEKKTGAGKNIIEQLVTSYHIDTIIAFELGLMAQQKANQKKIQLIIINEKNKTLKQILELLKFNLQ